jgi:hypothetical protein
MEHQGERQTADPTPDDDDFHVRPRSQLFQA